MPIVGVDSEDDSDDNYDIGEANCEIAMVEGQLCSIPYELYDLPDLTQIISTETWNSFLTEEERYLLSCFLPDMDQDTFTLTLQELVGGSNLYFGNPVEKFYTRLRGGLFAPKVACCKEGLTMLKRKRYYYSLKSYHEKMNKTFVEMQRLWGQYGKGLGNKGSQREDLKLLDLNRVPSEIMDGGASYKLETPNEVKSVERNRSKSLTSSFCGGTKESLKIKITDKGVFQHKGSSLLVSSEHRHQTLRKGLLKVAPKYSSAIFEEPYVATENNFMQVYDTGPLSSTTGFAASPFAGTRYKKPNGTVACSITEVPKCLLNHQDTSFTHLETTESSFEGIDPALHELTDTNPRYVGTQKCSVREHNLPTKQEEYAYYCLKYPGFKLGMVDRGLETVETKRVLGGMNSQRESKVVRKPRYVVSKDNHNAPETGDDHLFPSTYKRRKFERISIA
ncbi:unnamed protein product [Cochlearia groenlandica]